MKEVYTELLNIKNLEIERVEMSSSRIDIYCKIDEEGVCLSCYTVHKKINQRYRRTVRDLDMSGRKVYLRLEVLQYHCPNCKRTHSQNFDFVESGKSHTKRQSKWIFELSAKQNHKEVGALLDIVPKTVERIFYQEAENLLPKTNWSGISRIGIDEYAFKKGHKDFIVILVDLDTHDIIELLPFRDKAKLIAYFQDLGSDFCDRIKWYSSDMWGPFLDVATAVFPNAKQVIDRFHWTKHLNDVLDSFRKELRRNDKENDVYKHLKWKLIKRPENLSKEEKDDLKKALATSCELEEIYEMRNTLVSIFDMDFDFERAKKEVQFWIQQAEEIGNEYLNNSHFGVLGFYFEKSN